ncbi:MAG: CHAT domain-containing protein [Microcoleus sp. T3-bin5]|nr:CHAT domain-containing protein [Microcoleus sp. T3-bin5]
MPVMSADKIREILSSIARQTGKNPALVTVNFANNSDTSQLELVLVTPEGSTKRTLSGGTRKQVLDAANKFRSEITNPTKKSTTSYLPVGQQLYQWLVAPLEADMQEKRIDTLIVSLHPALRSLPLAALHDGNKFLIEKYSISLIPSFSTIGDRYVDIKASQVLAMGASKFAELNPLPGVPVELSIITQKVWKGKSFLNEEFTLNNLKSQRQPYGIIHLATHADFQAGDSSNSYIQLGDSQLKMNQLRQLRWNQPPQIELLVLSACRTALGDVDAELGFGGLAVQAGVKSALASLWYVSDGGTLALMSEFYRQLSQPDVTIKAEALRRAQIAGVCADDVCGAALPCIFAQLGGIEAQLLKLAYVFLD